MRLIDRVLGRDNLATAKLTKEAQQIKKSKDVLLHKDNFKLINISDELSISTIRDDFDDDDDINRVDT